MVVICAGAVRVIIGLNPYVAAVRWEQPSPIHPNPSTPAPIPITVRPQITRSRRYTHWTDNSRRRWWTTHADADIDADACKRG